ncbi:RNA polymerase I associated factor, A49-like protein [Kalaharituber pfeilii]|nr:RNA polymerase I associated factor, A49-like protein [Kalaharituber pfeilii]
MATVEKKRKRSSHARPTELTIKAANSSFIPIVATTPGVTMPSNTSLIAYSRPRATKKNKSNTGAAVEYIVHGATERIDYEGRELQEDAEVEKYFVGIYDPETGEVEVHAAPRVHVRREIKALRERDAELAKRSTAIEGYNVSRAILGAEFGTKKSKKAIERRDLNQIDVKDMDASVTTSIVSQIGENTESMPTREDLDKAHEEKMLLPPHKTEGITSPAEVYRLEDVVSKEELDVLWVQDWYEMGKSGVVQVPNNSHVTNRIAKLGLVKTPNATNTRKLKLLKYISILRNFYTFLTNRAESERLLLTGKEIEIRHRLNISSDLLSILLKKYTETVGGPTKEVLDDVEGGKELGRPRRKSSPALLTKLLNWIVIICLFVEENFQVDVFYLKDDLGLQTRDMLQVFTNVGCRRKDLTPIQADALGISKSEAKLHRIAYLTAKPEFPKPRARKKAGGQR